MNRFIKAWHHRISVLTQSAFFLILLLVTAFSSFIGTLRDLSPDPTQQILDDSLEIYSSILVEVYPQERVYIIDRPTQPYRGRLDAIMKNNLLPSLQQETAEEFEAMSEVPQDLSVIFKPADQRFILINPAEFYVDRSVEGAPQCYWMMMKCFDKDRFSSSYPGSTGYIQFSNIGFNSDHTQALATAEIHNESLSGTIFLVLLSYKRGSWEIEDNYEVYWVV